eukprot:301476-Amorphochlora_amoeboformis.AAC.1
MGEREIDAIQEKLHEIQIQIQIPPASKYKYECPGEDIGQQDCEKAVRALIEEAAVSYTHLRAHETDQYL